MTMTLDDLLSDVQVSQQMALEAINAAANAVGIDEAAHLQAAEDLLTHASKVRTVIDEFWSSVPDNAWSWDAEGFVSVRGVA